MSPLCQGPPNTAGVDDPAASKAAAVIDSVEDTELIELSQILCPSV